MPEPKILHVSAAKTWRGGERQLAFLVDELAKKKISQAVLCIHGSAMAKWCRQHDLPFFTYRKIFSLNPVVAMHIRWICRRLKITHVHVHDSHAHTFSVLAASWLGNRASIIVHRRVDFPVGGNFFSKWKYNHPAISRIICVSGFVKRLIQPVLRHPEKVQVVHDGIDLESMPPQPTFADCAPPYKIGNIAAIAPHKDYFTFVRTAEILLRNGLPAQFLIIGGDGGERAAVEAFIAQKKLSENVKLLGFRKDVPELIGQLDLLLFTSKTEGLGSTILDAFAAGLPVVATRAGGIPEVVENEVTGLLAPVGDAAALAWQVRRMLEDAELREHILANAKVKVRQFSKQKMAERVLACYT